MITYRMRLAAGAASIFWIVAGALRLARGEITDGVYVLCAGAFGLNVTGLAASVERRARGLDRVSRLMAGSVFGRAFPDQVENGTDDAMPGGRQPARRSSHT